MGEWGPHSHKHKLNMADFILNMPLRFFARVFGNPAGDPVLLKSRGVTLLRDKKWVKSVQFVVFLAVFMRFLPKFDWEHCVLAGLSVFR